MQPRIESLEIRRLFAAAAVTHIYELNNSLADSLGGPSLSSFNGSLTSTGFNFADGGGLAVSNAVNSTEYSIELKFDFSAASNNSWRRIISFKNLTDDTGLYQLGNSLNYFSFTGNGATAVPNGTVHDVVLTREAATKKITGFVNGVQQWQFVDTTGSGVFSSAGSIAQFFRDNTSGGTVNEQDPGFVDRIRIYSGVLTGSQVVALHNGGTPPGLSAISLSGAGVLTLQGTSGADAMSVTASGANLVAKVGAASKTFSAASVKSISISGSDGNDTITIGSTVTKPSAIFGGNGNDNITGGGGNDVIDGGLGSDVINGGGGIDTATYATRTAPVYLFLDGRANDGQAGERDNIGSDIEILIGGSANDVLIGNDFANTLLGNAGSDYLFGAGGNDSLDGGAGDDELSGGDGNDVLTGGLGSDQIYGDAGNDKLFARSSPADHDILDGGAGIDSAQKDSLDSSTGIETVLP